MAAKRPNTLRPCPAEPQHHSTQGTSPIPPRWATVNEGAAYVGGINPRTVREWISTGLIPGYKFGPRFVRIDLNDLDAMASRIPTAGTWDGDAA